MNDSISIIDVNNFKIIDANPVFLKNYGLKKEEVIGKSCFEITHKRAQPCIPPYDFCPLIDTLNSGEHAVAEHVHYMKDGEKRFEEISTSPIKDSDGRITGVIHVAHDITERKLAVHKIQASLVALKRSQEEQSIIEQELKKHRTHLEELVEERTFKLNESSEQLKISEEKYRSLVESTEDFIYMVDRDCRYLFMNNKHRLRLGIEDYRDRIYNEFHSLEESQRFIENVNHVFDTGKPTQVEHEYNGRWFNQSLSPIKNETGIVTSVTVVSSDISERKKAEEFRIENGRLAYANKAKSEFLSNMSHELRTPLNAIIGFSELLKKKGKGTLNNKMEHYVDIVIISSNFLLNLINDILDLSKIEAGKIELVYDKMNLNDTLHDILLLIKEKADSHNILIKKDFDPGLSFIEADTQRFKQVVFNLLSNAVKFMAKEVGIITISTKKEGDMVKISISDTGIGIKEEDIGKLFNAFEQVDSGISRKYGGTGLGLAISKKFIELHGGKIWVTSKFGEGTTFTFVLPILKVEP
jgi:PAS domain S-box-containing protein